MTTLAKDYGSVSLLSVKGLRVSFKTPSGPVEIVQGVDLEVGPSTIYGLAGESGCGKSLTALAVMGILPPNMRATGPVLFMGRDLFALPPGEFRSLRGRDLAMIFQEPMTSLNPVMRVGRQIGEVLTTHMRLSTAEADRAAVELMRAVRIPSPEVRSREYPHQMSGGMRQRIMIAMAIACNPSLLIADEPTTALDVTIEAQVLELLRGLREEKGMSVLLITHDLGVIAENCERAAVMYAGRIVEEASVEEIFRSPAHPYTMGLLRSLPGGRGKALKPIPGTVPRPGHLPEGCKFSDRCEYVISNCRKEEPLLRPIRGTQRARCIRSEEIKWTGV